MSPAVSPTRKTRKRREDLQSVTTSNGEASLSTPTRRGSRRAATSPYFKGKRAAKTVFESPGVELLPDSSTSSPSSATLLTQDSLTCRYFTRRSARLLETAMITESSVQLAVQPKDLWTRLLESKPTLIQERVAHDPWRLMVAVSLLNKTRASVAVPVFWRMMDLWPTASDLANASLPDLVALLTPLGLQNGRAARLVLFSAQYVASPPCTSRLFPLRSDSSYPPSEIAQYAGMGRYAVDSWRIYSPLLNGGGAPRGALEITEGRRTSGTQNDMDEEWKTVLPGDKELKKYLIWRWAVEGYQWSPEYGRGSIANDTYLESILSSE